MIPRFNYDSVKCSSDDTKECPCDVAAALIRDECEMNTNTQLYLPAYPTQCGTGDVASNFRFKHNKETNNSVCGNWLNLLGKYKEINDNPVVVTAFHRNNRLRSIKMNEDGTVTIYNKMTKEKDDDESKLFEEFLQSVDIDFEIMKKMRESSKGAKYYSYLSDALSLLNTVYFKFKPEMFFKKRLMCEIVCPNDVDSEGGKRLTPIMVDSKEWVPNEGFNYLYFKECDNGVPDSMDYFFLKEENIPFIYGQFFKLLSKEENEVKQLVRRFFSDINTYYRWSDYWVNDIDDALTIKCIIHSYNYTSLTEQEISIKGQFIQLSESIFS